MLLFLILKVEKLDSFRNILKEVLNTDRGTKFYVITKVKEEDSSKKEENKDENDILALDEVIPNTKFILEAKNYPYLIDSIISINLFKNVKDV